eukprot:CAMPEP_0174251994 /NCGR_PEP_ID=MMETSP0439-20130205/1651_1 /TAXON_ID=0 /ORGANISM="Stereomyxa ramosa, Strain Chinc5" /LENGTH=155 /DNA_ID=CAMNT_0015332463 /DNA_START=48 /DNA_END=515 /DNA_ORIENTATION=+
MADQDWETVTFKKRKPASNQRATTKARQEGRKVVTEKKFAAGSNQQRSGVNANRFEENKGIDEEPDAMVMNTLSRAQSVAIQQGRQNKRWSQKDFAQKINQKVTVVNEYERGTATPNQQVLAKMERVLGIKLRGKNIGDPLPTRASKRGRGRGKS